MFEAVSYTNHIGQTLNPGDTVIYVGTSYKNTSVKIGVFSGVYKEPGHKYNSETRKYEDAGLKDFDSKLNKRTKSVLLGEQNNRNTRSEW